MSDTLVLLTSFYDREEALVAKGALDSAGLFVVLDGIDRLTGMPELRGAAPLALYGLKREMSDAMALLTWREPGVGEAEIVAYLRAPLKDQLWALVTHLLGLGGVPPMAGWPRRYAP